MASTTNNKKITLYLNVVCPYAQRAWQTAVEKGLEFEAISVPLRGDKPDWCVFFVRLGALMSNTPQLTCTTYPQWPCAGTGR